ncbi:MAG: PQQ-dependent sugar dehydrogenase [Cytophagales bacterium]|nr:PQQ-dependent sugar dehydrogenase [Cytophagales bacterium]
MKTILLIISIGIVCVAQNSLKIELVADKLISPIGIVSANDGTGRLFVQEQQGIIYIIDKGKLLSTPFLNMKYKIDDLNRQYDEKGLLGLAFHPKYKENGRFFVYYSSNRDKPGQNHIAILSEFKTDPKNPNKALPAEKIILTVDQPEWNHNGGQLLFDKDGMLMLGLGDGGSGGDPHGKIGNAQDLTNLLGKIIRIDINSTPYAIPKDNPFVGKADAKPEIWAYGLRNPWRFSIDNVTGMLICGDVGQNKYEEVDIIEKGKNYGWRVWEGYHCFNPDKDCPEADFVKPITEYDRSEGSSVTGGYVYRGKNIDWLVGKYVFADWKGQIFILTPNEDKTWKRDALNMPEVKNMNINSFGEDENKELYICVQSNNGPFQITGKVYKIVK